MIQFQNVCFKIKNRTILDDISYDFPNQGVVIIQGEIGSGKTMILNLIARQFNPSSGHIRFSSEVHPIYDIFYNTFHNNFILHLTVKENIQLLFNSQQQEEVKTLLQNYNIGFLWNRTCNKLSSGEQQKIAIIMAYVRKSRITLLDEPICNLDKKSVKVYCELLQKLGNESLVILCMHENFSDVLPNACVLSLEEGKITERQKELSSESLNFRKNEVNFRKSLSCMMPFFWKKKKLPFVFFLLSCLFLIFGIACFVDLKTTSDVTLYQRGVQNYGPQSVDIKIDESCDALSYANKIDLNCQFHAKQELKVSSVYMTDFIWMQGKKVLLHDNDVYISDYLYASLISGAYQDLNYFIPENTSKEYNRISDISLSCFVIDESRILENVNFIVYETDYRKYLPEVSKEDYDSQVRIFRNRVNSYYLNVYTTSHVVARAYADSTRMVLPSGIVYHDRGMIFNQKQLSKDEFYASTLFLAEYFQMDESEIKKEEFLKSIDGTLFNLTFKTQTNNYNMQLKFVLGINPSTGITVNEETYNQIYQSLQCELGENFVIGEEITFIDASSVDFGEIVSYLQNPDLDFLQKNYVLDLVQSRDENQILFTCFLTVFSIIWIALTIIFIFFLYKKEVVVYQFLLNKGYNQINFYTLCFLPQMLLFIFSVILSLILFYLLRIPVAGFFHMV